MSKRTYNWKRYYKGDVVSFESIASTPCLVLLGEPGIGKSTALDRENVAVRKTLSGSGDGILRFDLGESSARRRPRRV
jgi:hypothetical protein